MIYDLLMAFICPCSKQRPLNSGQYIKIPSPFLLLSCMRNYCTKGHSLSLIHFSNVLITPLTLRILLLFITLTSLCLQLWNLHRCYYTNCVFVCVCLLVCFSPAVARQTLPSTNCTAGSAMIFVSIPNTEVNIF